MCKLLEIQFPCGSHPKRINKAKSKSKVVQVKTGAKIVSRFLSPKTCKPILVVNNQKI